MKQSTNKKTKLFRILAFFGLGFLLTGTINNFIIGVNHIPFTKSILYPHTNYLVPIINVSCTFFTIIFILCPTKIWLILFVLLVEATHLILTGYHYIGVFLYINSLILFFCFGYAQKKFKLKSIISISILFFLLFTLIPSYGLGEFFFSIGLTFFSLACYVIIYKLLSDKLSFLLGDYYIPDYAPLLDLPEKGSTLDLHKLNLTERQIACIHYTIDSTYNYKKIAEELITSESTVKKNMQDLYKLFGVKNREMLRLLLIQYTII